MNGRGLKCNTSLLGEHVKDEAVAVTVVDRYIEVLDRIKREHLKCNVAVKLTHLGLDAGIDVAYRNLQRLVRHAGSLNAFIRIDMEESARVDATLAHLPAAARRGTRQCRHRAPVVSLS